MSASTTVDRSKSGVGLSHLHELVLTDERQRVLDTALAVSGGSPVWRARKEVEAREVMALSQRAPAGRMEVVYLDVSAALRLIVHLKVPAPCRPGSDGELRIEPFAHLGIIYPLETLREVRSGTGFVQILAPGEVWHANVLADRGQPLCLGASLPPGIRVKELILMSYGALSMQSVMLDEGDAAGVLNLEAARWWQQNLDRIPLSRTPFLGADDLEYRPSVEDAC